MDKFTFTDTEFISSNSFARISDVVFSEVISENEFKDIKSIDSLVIDKPYSEIDYLNTKFDLKENYVIFCNTEYLANIRSTRSLIIYYVCFSLIRASSNSFCKVCK